jgi:hypothetical protein
MVVETLYSSSSSFSFYALFESAPMDQEL